jgi:hypothetical protein
MEERGSGLSQRLPQRLEPLSDAEDEALMGETDNALDTTEPAEKPATGVKRGTRIGWWW